jgi:hypothetical protein
MEGCLMQLVTEEWALPGDTRQRLYFDAFKANALGDSENVFRFADLGETEPC